MKIFKDILCVVGVGEYCKPVLTRTVTLMENNQASLTVIDEILNQIDCSVHALKQLELATLLRLDD